ncbi:hypothetical protein ACIHCV_42310 [Streptomyces sp. NPDC051956]|uniref:hypothetical protein n=1 Tax=Streptomyces sp. NPDC051956 TaxID=3365677 RepID=UPI0037D49513
MTRYAPSARQPLGRSLPLRLSVLLAVLTGLLLAGCGGVDDGDNPKGGGSSASSPSEESGEPDPGGTPLAGTDWEAVIDTIDCTDAGNEGVAIMETKFADVRGRGVPDAFVAFQCVHQASSFPQQVEVYDGSSSPEAPRRIAVLLSAEEDAHGPGPRLGGISFSGKSVTLSLATYTAQDPFCCPSLREKRTFTWNGERFERAGATSS